MLVYSLASAAGHARDKRTIVYLDCQRRGLEVVVVRLHTAHYKQSAANNRVE